MVKAAVLNTPGKLDIIEFDVPNVKDGILINIIASGVCGTDPHIIDGTRETSLPIIVGHEFYGEIIKIGSNHKVLCTNGKLNQGDLIAIVPGTVCGICGYCAKHSDEPHLCTNRKAYGISLKSNEYPYLVGGFSQKVIIKSGFYVHKVPKNWPIGLGALFEPMAVATRCVKKAFRHIIKRSVDNKLNIVILGCGPIGFSVLLNLNKREHNIYVIDPIEHRRELALRYGATRVFDPFTNENWMEDIKSLMYKIGPDLIIESAGTLKAFRDSLDLIRRGGIIAELGNFADVGFINLHPSQICRNDIMVLGSVLGPPSIYLEAEKNLSKIISDYKQILYPSYCLNDIDNAVQNVKFNKKGIKTIIFPNE